MALPKEPRQKMINLMYLVLTALLALNVSSEILNAFKVVDISLQNSSTNLATANNTLYESLTQKLTDPKTADKAHIWQPLAEKAKILSDTMTNYIEGLKKELKTIAGLERVNGKESFKEDNLEAATHLFDTQGKGKELEARLKAYKAAMLAIDPKINEKFAKTLPVDVEPPIGQDGTKNDFTTAYFHMTPTVAGLTLLSKFQNNIKNSENQVVTFCHEQIGAVEIHMDKVGVLTGQNSNYLMPGQELVVTAGVGAYSSSSNATISINGNPVSVENGQGIYKTTVSGAGEHTVPINITFKGEDGKLNVVPSTIKYTVGTPGGAAVMLDKMNVFYIGVDNPITISSGSGWDKTNVVMSGGTLTGTNGTRVVRVTTPGKATITVTADQKTTPFDFRVKRIPDPVIKVGPSGGGRMAAVVFRSQQFVRADLEAFDFEAHYNVVGATVYFNIPGDRNVKQITLTSGNLAPAKAYMDLLVPGSTVTFDNIKVLGPDGTPRTIQNPPGFSLF